MTVFTAENLTGAEKVSVSTRFSSGRNAEGSEFGVNFNEREGNESTDMKPQSRASVDDPCPRCKNPTMYFYTMQMRSVDEGQTVFYECPKCSYTYNTNT
jgi:DNA-directed RNA polymerase subunit M/transcription elongation factor TFIIS